MALKQVEALYGPYAGAIISIEEADAEKAIGDGWARDPYDPKNTPAVDLSKQPEVDQEKIAKATKDAEEYATKLRGESDETGTKKPAPAKPTTSSRTSTASGSTSSYDTRQSKAAETKSSEE